MNMSTILGNSVGSAAKPERAVDSRQVTNSKRNDRMGAQFNRGEVKQFDDWLLSEATARIASIQRLKRVPEIAAQKPV
jgi:hypothetical protein